jgi:pyruvate,water dikinase
MRQHAISLFLLLLAASPALAQDRHYEFEARPYFGGDRFEARMTLSPLPGDRYRVSHQLKFPGEDWGVVASGEGGWSGRYLIVRFKDSVGAQGKLADLFANKGSLAPASDSLAYYWSAGQGKVKGALRLNDGTRQMWIREDGRRVTAPAADYLTSIPDRATFERFARRDNVPGAMGVREVKFLVTGVGTPNPTLYFFNTKKWSYHHEFATQGLNLSLTLQEFNSQTYFTDNRKFMAGSLIAHDNYDHPQSGKGIYTLEFWPTDPVKTAHVAVAYSEGVAGLPFATDKVYYHPAGDTHERLYQQDKAEFQQRRIKVIGTQDLFANVTFSALNLGEGYGVLRLMDGADPRPASARDVVIFKTLPNDLSHVAGVITELPQTPLSHINLKAKQNDTPNAYVKGVSSKAEVQALLGKMVHYKVSSDGYTLEEADPAEAAAWLEKIRPKTPQVPQRDLSVKQVKSLADLGHSDVVAFGAKAANLAELRQILPSGEVPNGFAVPFHYYDAYMKHNRFYAAARTMVADAQFKADPAVRERALRRFRRTVRRGTLPPGMEAELGAIQAAYPPAQPLRCRSSTNNEDLEGFNGAGLYDSHTHRPNEGHIGNTIKQVWSKLWTYRAFEERDFYRIDHFQAAMGVLVHPNFDDEQANGVAVTKNIYDPNWKGFYVNAQVGESLVTNPDAGATPDEFLVARLGPQGEYEVQYVQRTNQPLPAGRTAILTAPQISALVRSMEKIQRHFKRVYKAQNDDSFAMDIEFKITKEGKLAIKQARPWID